MISPYAVDGLHDSLQSNNIFKDKNARSDVKVMCLYRILYQTLLI